jgi:hypothetical protein
VIATNVARAVRQIAHGPGGQALSTPGDPEIRTVNKLGNRIADGSGLITAVEQVRDLLQRILVRVGYEVRTPTILEDLVLRQAQHIGTCASWRGRVM